MFNTCSLLLIQTFYFALLYFIISSSLIKILFYPFPNLVIRTLLEKRRPKSPCQFVCVSIYPDVHPQICLHMKTFFGLINCIQLHLTQGRPLIDIRVKRSKAKVTVKGCLQIYFRVITPVVINCFKLHLIIIVKENLLVQHVKGQGYMSK